MKALVRDMRAMLSDVGSMKFGPELLKGVAKTYKEVPGKVQNTVNKAKKLHKKKSSKKAAKKQNPKKYKPLNGVIDGKFTVTKRIISDNAP